MKWKTYFDEERIKRGYQYYQEGKVYNTIITPNTITTKVEGSHSHTYEVKITLNKDKQIESMYCTCPYAYSMDYCKHMVATLYKYEEITKNKDSNITNNIKNPQQQFKQLLDNTSEIELKEYIYQRYKDDEDFIKDYNLQFKPDTTREDYYEALNLLNNIFSTDTRKLYNENAYYEELPLNKYLYDFLNNNVKIFYDKCEFDYLQRLIYIIYENISLKDEITQYIDVDNILDMTDYYLEKVIESDNETKDDVFNYILNNIQYEYNKYTSIHLAQVCIKMYDKKSYLQKLSDIISLKIKQYDDNIPVELLAQQYEILKKIGTPIVNIEKYLEKFRNYNLIRQYYIDYEINENNYYKAIELLCEKRQLGSELSLDENKKLLQLYDKTEDNVNYKKELKNILNKYTINDIAYVNRLKETCTPDEWKKEYSTLVNSYQRSHNYDFLNVIYVNEENYDALYENLINHFSLDSFEEYKKYLEDRYGMDILMLYKNRILEEAKVAKHRGAYNLIIRYIKAMLSYKNSKDIVTELINILKNKYKNKNLLITELRDIEQEYQLD
ncbi:SWIM zinc finger family protein [Candidatus Methanosphaera massiliense]|jgi:hypothetical protein|uniref:SWIM zinc finger family protein n=1 Tax=Methanosphaera TaxID=2316 RepID=UPI0023800356|nr:SWIM zinc finger family protein [Candidatus Methanosphaera massiliense]MDD6285487.1 SWIM zinc finger family protein [Methanobacteriaceae archaeon]MDE4078632.1 SWIM zinc finger family protein [Candidatus Methanosphaera massiliense]MDY2744338.1 SWIM zinc finger family protein [Methanosphaera sp.]